MKTDDVINDVARRMTATAGRPDLRMRVVAGIGDEARGARRLEGRRLLAVVGRTFRLRRGYGGPPEPCTKVVRFGQPALAGSVVACAALVWMLMPARAPESPAPVMTTARVVTTPAPAIVHEAAPTPGASTQIVTTTRASTSRTVARPAAEESAAPAMWTDVDVEWTIPALPPLAEPPPIVIEPIAWDEITIVPLTVAAIEVKALEVEPLDAGGVGGV